jgi:hypothetical protein
MREGDTTVYLFLSLGMPPKYRVQLQYFGMGSYRKKKRRGRTNLAELGAHGGGSESTALLAWAIEFCSVHTLQGTCLSTVLCC